MGDGGAPERHPDSGAPPSYDFGITDQQLGASPWPTGPPSRTSRSRAASTTAYGYLAVPPAGHGPGIILIQEWWGLTAHIKDVADRFAKAGFVVLAPDLYGGQVAHDADEALRMMSELPTARGVELLSGAVGHLLKRPETDGDTVGAVGFCMGGGFVLGLAAKDRRVSAAVPFYGVNQDGIPDFSHLEAEILGHYGEQDPTVPPHEPRRAREDDRGPVRHRPDVPPLPGRGPRLLQRRPLRGVPRRSRRPGVAAHTRFPAHPADRDRLIGRHHGIP